MLQVVNYGVGNISAISTIFKRLGVAHGVATTTSELKTATRIVLPGVGAFDWAMEKLNASGMRDVLDELVLNKQVPVLGICVGMQMMAKGSEEGKLPGLKWIDAEVVRLSALRKDEPIRLPHMGWNDVQPMAGSKLFAGLETDARFYFLHSFFFECKNSQNSIATAAYGLDFSCAVSAKNVYGVQFHPEKSHHYGAQLLKNFAEL